VRNDGFRNSFCDQPDVAAQTARTNGMEFVPMFWGGIPTIDDDIDSNLQQASYLLTFNEPELEEQANISPTEAALLWSAIETIASTYELQIVAPCLTHGQGETWFVEWELQCNLLYGRHCQYDFGCLHMYYQPYHCDDDPTIASYYCIEPQASRARNELQNWYDLVHQKQLWITEYACAPWGDMECTETDDWALLHQLTWVLEESPHVFRYAWFTMYNFGSHSGNSLNELIWDRESGVGCTNREWVQSFGSSSWKIETIQECMATAESKPELCHQPLALTMTNNNCYCSADSCASTQVTYPQMTTYFQINDDRDSSTLTPNGELYNRFTLDAAHCVGWTQRRRCNRDSLCEWLGDDFGCLPTHG
jgi:hypothetical protein